MAYTAATALTEVRSLIQEPIAAYWTDTEINEWIKQGCLDWCEKTLLLCKEDTITLVANQVQYTTSTNSYIDNAIRTLHAEYNNVAMQRVRYEQLRGHNAMKLATDPAPKYFFDKYDGTSFTVYVAPTPSATYDSTIMSVLFAIRTDDITEIPYEYQQVIFLFAASKAKVKERQWQESALLWNQYVNNIAFSRRDTQELGQLPTKAFRIE